MFAFSQHFFVSGVCVNATCFIDPDHLLIHPADHTDIVWNSN